MSSRRPSPGQARAARDTWRDARCTVDLFSDFGPAGTTDRVLGDRPAVEPAQLSADDQVDVRFGDGTANPSSADGPRRLLARVEVDHV